MGLEKGLCSLHTSWFLNQGLGGERLNCCMNIYLPSVSGLGVLLRKVETGIRGISHVIVDEIHERDINVS